MNKKAVSPIISSILLIIFAVALGIVVMSWGKSTTVTEEKGSCTQASLNIIKIAEKPKLCIKDNVVYFTIENNGEIKTTGLKISFIGDSIYQKDLMKGSIVGEIINMNTNFADAGKIQKIKITPKITVEGKELVCPNSGIEIEDIGECQNV